MLALSAARRPLCLSRSTLYYSQDGSRRYVINILIDLSSICYGCEDLFLRSRPGRDAMLLLGAIFLQEALWFCSGWKGE